MQELSTSCLLLQVFQTGRSHMVVLTRPPPNAPLPTLGSAMESPRDHSTALEESARDQDGSAAQMPGTVTVEVHDSPQQQPTEVRRQPCNGCIGAALSCSTWCTAAGGMCLAAWLGVA